MTTIYQELLLAHYQNPKNYGRIAKPTKTITVANPLCGDVMTMDIVVDGGKIKAIKFFGRGCVISRASGSLLTEFAKNKSQKELLKLGRVFIIKLLGVELGVNRIKCAMLPLEALQKLLISPKRR